MDAGGRHRPGGAIHLKEVNAAAIAGRQIHLGRQHIAERRAEGSDIGEERFGGFSRLRQEQLVHEGRCPRECEQRFSKTSVARLRKRNHREGAVLAKLHLAVVLIITTHQFRPRSLSRTVRSFAASFA